MKQQPERTVSSESQMPSESQTQDADPTRICWTQLLRASEDKGQPPLVLPVAPTHSSDDDLFP